MTLSETKQALRDEYRRKRIEHAAALPESVRGLVFSRPPAPVIELIDDAASIGLYHATEGEAPASGYARFFLEAGHTIALPRVTRLSEPMTFHRHTDPWEGSDLVDGPMGLAQPPADAEVVVPDVLIMPLVAFTEDGARLGQGGGFYDRWLAEHPQTLAIGMAWDCQQCESLPVEDHDMPLAAIVTPTRFYGPFA